MKMRLFIVGDRHDMIQKQQSGFVRCRELQNLFKSDKRDVIINCDAVLIQADCDDVQENNIKDVVVTINDFFRVNDVKKVVVITFGILNGNTVKPVHDREFIDSLKNSTIV